MIAIDEILLYGLDLWDVGPGPINKILQGFEDYRRRTDIAVQDKHTRTFMCKISRNIQSNWIQRRLPNLS